VNAYSKAIKFNSKNDSYYSNRSAAYIKLGDYEHALKDANKCIALNPKNHKGYGRKGAAYHAMKKYDRAISAYKDGLRECPDDENLSNTKVSKAVRQTKVAQKASKDRKKRVKDADGVSDFVKQTRKELKLQMAAIQSQLDLINELAAMEENEKLDLLFTLIDQDGDGTVDAKELATAMRKRNDELSFHDSIENAIDMVATFDVDGDAKLDHNEFRNYINVMLKELGVNFSEFSEFLVIQILFSENKDDKNVQNNDKDIASSKYIEEEVKAREVLFDMLSDERMAELFRLFDIDGTGVLVFKDVAVGLYLHAINDDSDTFKNERTLTAYNLLLMMDKNDKRTLNYEQFGRLMMAVVAAANCTFDDIADDLTLALTTHTNYIDDKTLTSLFVPDSVYQLAKEINRGFKKKGKSIDMMMNPLSFGRLNKLFQLWDVDGDQNLTLDELTDGLERFQTAIAGYPNTDKNKTSKNGNGVSSSNHAQQHALQLFDFDTDGNNTLDTVEFSCAMVHYAKSHNVDLHELIDFMCVTTVMGSSSADSKSFQAAYGRALGKDVIKKIKLASESYYEDNEIG
jgi:Ca2+-binding EF-hand superfamily protein